MSEHPEFDCVIAQMRSLEALFVNHPAETPVQAKDLLPICEAIRTLAARLALIMPAHLEESLQDATAQHS